MKKNIILSIALICCHVLAFAQNANVILFTENGEKFTVILNGLRQNEKPETNVKVSNLPAPQYKLKIIFDDPRLDEQSFNLFLEPNMERSFSIKKNSKGKYTLRFLSEVPSANAPAAPTNQRVVEYNPNGIQPNYSNTQTVVQQTTTTTTNPDNFNMGVNVNGMGVNVQVSDNGMNMNMNTTGTTTTTTTTTTNAVPPPAYLPGYTGAVGCPMPMLEPDFNELKSSIASKSFEETKMTIAKQVLLDHCLLTTQVKQLINLFTFEESKLEFAKYAYDYTYDRGNYFKVNDAFTFESSIEELNNYIASKR